MKWEPVENAENVLENYEFVLCWVEVFRGFSHYKTFEICRYLDGDFFVLNSDKESAYEVTHFMVVEEPNDENTNQAS